MQVTFDVAIIMINVYLRREIENVLYSAAKKFFLLLKFLYYLHYYYVFINTAAIFNDELHNNKNFVNVSFVFIKILFGVPIFFFLFDLRECCTDD